MTHIDLVSIGRQSSREAAFGEWSKQQPQSLCMVAKMPSHCGHHSKRLQVRLPHSASTRASARSCQERGVYGPLDECWPLENVQLTSRVLETLV